MSLNGVIRTAGRSLEVFTAGIAVAGQNVANAATPGYIREEINLQPSAPFERGQLVFGTGVQIDGIRQQIDLFLEGRIHTAQTNAADAAARSDAYLTLEAQLNELGDSDLSTGLSDFLAAVEAVVNEPENTAVRAGLVTEGANLARDVATLRSRIDDLRIRSTTTLEGLVDEANQLIDEIDRLNPQIASLEASGLIQSEAGALRTQRYTALTRLAEIVPISYQERSDGGVDVLSGANYLVLGGETQHLEIVSGTDRGVSAPTVRYADNDGPLPESGGEIAGIIQGRDDILGGFVDELDLFAAGLIETVNRVHSSGEGTTGRTSVVSDVVVNDTTAVLNTAGLLPFTPTHGSFDLKIIDADTGVATTTRIDVDLDGIGGNDTTLASLVASIDAVADVSASVDTLGRLQITAADGYEVAFASDSSGVLAALEVNVFFTGSDSSDIAIAADLAADPGLLATGRGGGPADNTNVAALAAALDSGVDSLGGVTLREHYQTAVFEVAQESAGQKALADGTADFVASLESQREQFSGVSIDEETIEILELQRFYQASARLISTADELFTILLNV
ncbi:MAG: flagellar hook-associated protein FlgK [Planctomycetota bacterium]